MSAAAADAGVVVAACATITVIAASTAASTAASVVKRFFRMDGSLSDGRPPRTVSGTGPDDRHAEGVHERYARA
ncbi:hypothetical protein GCM10009780_56150 [Actinomadura alba]